MKKEELVGLAVRLFAAYIAISTVSGLGTLMAFSETGPTDIPAVAMLGTVVIPLAVALFLWLLPLTVAHKLLPVMPEIEGERKAGPAEYQVVAFSVLGMWVLAQQLPALFFWVAYAFALPGEGTPSMAAEEYGGLASTAAGLLIGVWLLFGARGVAGIVRAARTAGTR